MKRITINAGKNAINPKKDLDNLKKHLYSFLFELKKMPEYELKWKVKEIIEPHIKETIKIMR